MRQAASIINLQTDFTIPRYTAHHYRTGQYCD